MNAARTSRRIFDAHLHVIDPRFPLILNKGFLPDPFTAEDYLKKTSSLDVVGGAVVSGSFQGFDQDYLGRPREARALFRRRDPVARGRTTLPPSVWLRGPRYREAQVPHGAQRQGEP